MTGNDKTLSEKQEQALKQFRIRLKDVMQPHFDDHYLLKWLRARNFDIDKGEAMLRNNISWRSYMEVDTIESWTPPEVLTKYYPGGLFGFNKDGLPVWIEPSGNCDIKGLLRSCKKSDLIKFKIQHCEIIQRALRTQAKQMNRHIDNIVVICDFDHYGMKNLTRQAIDIFKEVVKIFEPHYPETVKKTYIVNANRIFSILFNIAKPFLSEDTKSKMTMLGTNWKREILNEVDADQLPVTWGGTATDECGDPSCASKIGLGGMVPQSYWIQKHDLLDKDSFSKATVARGSTLELEYTSDIPHSVLSYQFHTENHDLAFCVYRRTSEEKQNFEDMEQISSHIRTNSHMVQEDGCIKLRRPGSYVVVFDNSFSWINSKKLFYNIQVLSPYDLMKLKRSDSFTPADDEIDESTRL